MRIVRVGVCTIINMTYLASFYKKKTKESFEGEWKNWLFFFGYVQHFHKPAHHSLILLAVRYLKFSESCTKIQNLVGGVDLYQHIKLCYESCSIINCGKEKCKSKLMTNYRFSCISRMSLIGNRVGPLNVAFGFNWNVVVCWHWSWMT